MKRFIVGFFLFFVVDFVGVFVDMPEAQQSATAFWSFVACMAGFYLMVSFDFPDEDEDNQSCNSECS